MNMSSAPDFLVSVIVPVYKAERCLEKCIESILGQTYRSLQLILIDDGSPDGSGAICDKYAEIDSRVLVLHTTNAGVSAARNRGISLAKGTFIAFVDSDDYLDPDFLADACNDIAGRDSDMYISGLYMETFKEGKMVDCAFYHGKEALYSVKSLFDSFDIDYPFICICGPWCKLYRADIIMNFDIRFDPRLTLGEDMIFNCTYLQYANTICFSPKAYYHYFRGNNESLFSRYYCNLYEINVVLYGEMRSLMCKVECDEKTLRRFDALGARVMIGCIYHEYAFRSESTQKSRLDTIRKVALDPYVRQCSLMINNNSKDFTLKLLLKNRMYRLIRLLFNAYYFES